MEKIHQPALPIGLCASALSSPTCFSNKLPMRDWVHREREESGKFWTKTFQLLTSIINAPRLLISMKKRDFQGKLSLWKSQDEFNMCLLLNLRPILFTLVAQAALKTRTLAFFFSSNPVSLLLSPTRRDSANSIILLLFRTFHVCSGGENIFMFSFIPRERFAWNEMKKF